MQIFPYLKVTKSDRALVGKQDPGKRIYRQSGPAEESGEWFERLSRRFPNERFVSPGGVSMFAPVSRAAVYQRLNVGGLTAFCYHPAKVRKTIFGGLRKTRETPYMYIPVSECKAWAEEVKKRFGSGENRGLSEKEFRREAEQITGWPKHTGKTSPPKWKQKKQAAQKSSMGAF
jgi:hypothetical protein